MGFPGEPSPRNHRDIIHHDQDSSVTKNVLGLLSPKQYLYLGLEGLVSKRKNSAYRSGRSPNGLKMKTSDAPAVEREAEEEWSKKKWR